MIASRTPPMFDDLKNAVARNPATLALDFAGAAAIAIVLFVGLTLPAVV